MSNNNNELNRQAMLKNGLAQYIGAMLENKDFEPREAAQLTVANLIEAAVKLAMKDDKIDFFVAKPIVRGAKFVIGARFNALDKAVNDEIISREEYDNLMRESDYLVDSLEKIIEGMK